MVAGTITKHAKKTPEELVRAVVGLFLCLLAFGIKNFGFFLPEYYLHKSYLLKSKISSQSIEWFGFYSLLKI